MMTNDMMKWKPRSLRIESVNGRPIEEYGYRSEFLEVPYKGNFMAFITALLEQCLCVRGGRVPFRRAKGLGDGTNVSIVFVDTNGQRRDEIFNTRRDMREGRGFSEEVLNGETNISSYWEYLPDLIEQEVGFSSVATKGGSSLVLCQVDPRTGRQRKFQSEATPDGRVRFKDVKGASAEKQAERVVFTLNEMSKKFTPTATDVDRVAYGLLNCFGGPLKQFERWATAAIRQHEYIIEAMNGKPLSEYGYNGFSTDSLISLSQTRAALAEHFVGVLSRGRYSMEEIERGVDVSFSCLCDGKREERRVKVYSGLGAKSSWAASVVSEGVSNCTQGWDHLPKLLKQEIKFDVAEGDEGFAILQIELRSDRRREATAVFTFGDDKLRENSQRHYEMKEWLNVMAEVVAPTQFDIEREVASLLRQWGYETDVRVSTYPPDDSRSRVILPEGGRHTYLVTHKERLRLGDVEEEEGPTP